MSRYLDEGGSDVGSHSSGTPRAVVGASSSALGWIGVALAVLLIATWAASDDPAPSSAFGAAHATATSAASAESVSASVASAATPDF